MNLQFLQQRISVAQMLWFGVNFSSSKTNYSEHVGVRSITVYLPSCSETADSPHCCATFLPSWLQEDNWQVTISEQLCQEVKFTTCYQVVKFYQEVKFTKEVNRPVAFMYVRMTRHGDVCQAKPWIRNFKPGLACVKLSLYWPQTQFFSPEREQLSQLESVRCSADYSEDPSNLFNTGRFTI